MSNGGAPYVGLVRGLRTGAGIGLGIAEEARRMEESKGQQEQRDLAANVGKIGLALKMIHELPKSEREMKRNIFNKSIVPQYNKLMSGPGSQVNGSEGLLGSLDEWPEGMDAYIKRAGDLSKLPIRQQLDAFPQLLAESNNDPALAPFWERTKARAKEQTQSETVEYLEMLRSGGTIDKEEAARSVNFFPEAKLEATKQYREEIKAAKQAEIRPHVLGSVVSGGDKIVTLDIGGGKTQKINLGKTAETAKFNAGEWRANMAQRAANLPTGDPKFDNLTPKQAQKALAEFNKSDPLKAAIAGAITGEGGLEQPVQPGEKISPEDEAARFLTGE